MRLIIPAARRHMSRDRSRDPVFAEDFDLRQARGYGSGDTVKQAFAVLVAIIAVAATDIAAQRGTGPGPESPTAPEPRHKVRGAAALRRSGRRQRALRLRAAGKRLSVVAGFSRPTVRLKADTTWLRNSSSQRL